MQAFRVRVKLGQSATIAEAMASGRALIFSFSGGAAKSVAPERDALAHRAGDAEDLARQIRRLVAAFDHPTPA